jgi:hypothetical protein
MVPKHLRTPTKIVAKAESRESTQSNVTPAGFAAIDSSPSSRVKKKRKKDLFVVAVY